MTPLRLKFVVVGVGGQGVVTTARTLARAALAAGLPATVGELHGMSQRGGAVQSTLVIGPSRTAFVEDGEADVVLGFEPLEVLRASSKVAAHTHVLLNPTAIVPFSLTHQRRVYPELSSVLSRLSAITPHVRVVEASDLAQRAGDVRAQGSVMLGALACLDILPFSPQTLLQAIEAACPESAREANRGAFLLGSEVAHHANPQPVAP